MKMFSMDEVWNEDNDLQGKANHRGHPGSREHGGGHRIITEYGPVEDPELVPPPHIYLPPRYLDELKQQRLSHHTSDIHPPTVPYDRYGTASASVQSDTMFSALPPEENLAHNNPSILQTNLVPATTCVRSDQIEACDKHYVEIMFCLKVFMVGVLLLLGAMAFLLKQLVHKLSTS
jgi:hypothetical protein